ncbi:5-formyltetrahydrofolate cyclo-ligase [Ruania albidiflava]|uniref:5-formyltetrahydrofolate cyclo-ligase n=1 Tax=Ruania albidiflava TaxID=366586 RepID=UPI0003B3E85C|nr:5-formyltetrahydrofolate cyclo-ligase [Ruania albidiflava]
MWSLASSITHQDGLELEDAKQLLRASVREHRKNRSEKEQRAAGEKIAEHARELLDGVRCAAAYASRPTEPNTAALLRMLDEAGVEILLPMLGPGLSRDWARYRPGDSLEVRAPGRPPDPEGPGLGEDAIAGADVVFAPALSVDPRGVRLGQGGGWYDRALRFARPETPVFAVIYDDERCTEPLPSAAHDRPVDGVLTPSGWELISG